MTRADGQRHRGGPGRRRRHPAADRAPRRARARGQPLRLWRGPLRRLLRASRRRRGALLPDAAVAGRGPGRHHGRGAVRRGRPHPVQQAILDRQAAQCGFCVAGIVVRAAALLEAEPGADAVRVAEALDRNLCRCGVAAADRRCDHGGEHAAMTDPKVPAHIADNPRLGTWLSVDGRRGSTYTSARSSSARASSPRSPRSPRTPSDCRSRRSGWCRRTPSTARTRGSPPAACRSCRPDPRCATSAPCVRTLTEGPVDPVSEYVDLIASAGPGHRPRPASRRRSAGTGARGRPQRGPPRPARQGARPPPLPRRPAARRAAARSGAAAAVVRRPAGRSSPRTGRRRAWSWCATGRSSAWSASARPTSTGRSTSSSATARGRSATCCPTRTTSSTWLRAGPHEEIPVRDEEPAPGAALRVVLQAVPGARLDRAELRDGPVGR